MPDDPDQRPTKQPGAQDTANEETAAAEIRRFAANAGWVVFAQVFAKASGLVLFIILARALGTADFGYFVFALAFTPLFFVFGNIGMNTAVVREIASDRREFAQLFASGLVLRFLLGLLALAVTYAIGVFLVDWGDPYAALVIVGLARFVDDLANHYLSAFRGFERMRFYALIDMGNRALSTVLTGCMLLVTHSLAVISTTFLLGSVGALLLGHAFLRRELPAVNFRSSANVASARRLLSLGTPLGLAGVLNLGAFRIDTVLLQVIRGPRQVALYATVYSMFEALAAVSWSLSSATLPAIARAKRMIDATRVFELTAGLTLVVLLPVVVTVPFASNEIVRGVFSTRYAPAASILPVLTVAALFYAAAQVARVSSIALGRRSSITWIAAATLAFNVALNSFTIPLYGFRGAAWVTLATEIFEACVLVALLHRSGMALRLRPLAVVPAVASAAVVVTLLAAGLRGWAALATAVAVYPIVLAAAGRLLARDQVRLLRSALLSRPFPP